MVIYDDEARQQLLCGARELYKAVKTTMGPTGRNVVIHVDGDLVVTHDGVTVAKGVRPKNSKEHPAISTGAELIKRAADKMNTAVGDGTTTVTVLTYHILKEANRLIAAGINPMMLWKELDEALKLVIAELDKNAEAIKTEERLAEVATISAGDKDLGELIAKVVFALGHEGVVSVEESQANKVTYDIVEGYELNAGFISPLMITDTVKGVATYENPAILVTDKKLMSIHEIIPFLDKILASGKKELLIISDGVDGEALANLIANKMKGILNCVAVELPAYFKENLQDVAAVTGATIVSNDSGLNFQSAELDCLGTARKIIVSQDKTVIIQGAGDTKERLLGIERELKKNPDQSLKVRKAQLTGKVAVIKVGGATETELEEKKFRVDDAIAAAKAALGGGIVPGGGVALINSAKVLDTSKLAHKLLYEALHKPFRILLSNAGQDASEWLPQVKQSTGRGIDVTNPTELIDLKTSGIIDPAMVTKEALQTAVSIAGMAMTMGALVVDDVEDKEE